MGVMLIDMKKSLRCESENVRMYEIKKNEMCGCVMYVSLSYLLVAVMPVICWKRTNCTNLLLITHVYIISLLLVPNPARSVLTRAKSSLRVPYSCFINGCCNSACNIIFVLMLMLMLINKH